MFDVSFKYINLITASTAVLILYFFPDVGWWPLLIFVIPWLVFLLLNKRLPLQRTPLDWFLLLFVITAVIGVWAAYNKEAAFTKLWLILGATLFFYAITARPKADTQFLTVIVGCLALMVTIQFMLVHQWDEIPASLATINRIAMKWSLFRPDINNQVNPSAAEGVMVITLPILLFQAVWAIYERQWRFFSFLTIVIASVLIGLLFSTSRGAWVALLLGAGFIVLWVIKIKFSEHLSNKAIISILLVILVCGIGLLAILGASTNLSNIYNLPELRSSRLNLAFDALKLIEDFPFTGGGLDAFSGLYSHYILVIPYNYSSHSHNLVLNISLEQGLIGILAFCGIFGTTFLLLFLPSKPLDNSSDFLYLSLLKGVLIATFIALLIHGLIDDPLYSSQGVLFLFLIPGLVVAWLDSEQVLAAWALAKWSSGLLVASILFIFVGIAFYKPLAARWHSNLAAVEMAQVELKNWPSVEWNDSRNLAQLGAVEERFTQALSDNASIRTAYHRLGSIEMLRTDYGDAISYLKKAFEMDPQHRGIRKSLGYSYVWAGDIDAALIVLDEIPEAQEELNTYIWWWGTQGREDLADQAIAVLTLIGK